MGYVSKDIAVISEPDVLTLASAPNFVQFASKPGAKTYLEYNIQVNTPQGKNLINEALIVEGYVRSNGALDTGAGPTTGWLRTGRVVVSPSTTYTFSAQSGFNAASGSKNIAAYGSANNFISLVAVVSSNPFTFTTPPGAANIVMNLKLPADTTPAQIMIERGSAATSYLPYFTDVETKSLLNITDPVGTVYSFHGTIDPAAVGGSVFYISEDSSNTAENLREALLNNDWVAANFQVSIPFTWVGTIPSNGRVLNFKSKGTGKEYQAAFAAPNNVGNVAYTITAISPVSTNNDSISGEDSTAEIELDVYLNPAVFYGQDARPVDNARLGTYAVSLQKTYSGTALWFELNALFRQYNGFTLPPSAPGWFNTGTVQAYRFIAKKKGTNNFAFYQSFALFVLNGYGPASEDLDLNKYAYGAGVFKLLTNKPQTTYVRGQRAYLNFIFKDPQRDSGSGVNFPLRIAYQAFTTSGEYIGTVYNHVINRLSLAIVNTCVLNIDSVLDTYPRAGFVRVALANGNAILTSFLEYEIRPDCLHKLAQFTFLNRLGGWDAFNFDASPQDDIKPTSVVFNKTLTPTYKRGDSIETVYGTGLQHTITVQGAPVSDEVAEWLKELAAARVVLDGDGNYIILEDLSLKTSEATQNMQVPTIKYRHSETFTND